MPQTLPPGLARRVIDAGIHAGTHPTLSKHIRATNAATLTGALLIGVWGLTNLAQGRMWLGAENCAVAGVYLGVWWINRHGKPLAASLVFNLALLFQLSWAVWMFGSASGAGHFFPGALVFAYLSTPRSHRWMAHGLSALAALGFVGSVAFAEQLPPRVVLMPLEHLRTINSTFAMLTMAVLTAVFVRAIDATEDSLIAAEGRVDRLLLNVLPPSVVHRLKADPAATIADQHPHVTVLFADIVGFTPLASQLTPGQTVEMLNEVFTAFDSICESEGAMRIKTMGDGYLAVCGAPEAHEGHAEVMVRVATRMRAHMASDAVDDGLRVRIGLNSGPVVAGIIGVGRFAYDIWGDTVNVAARMESGGVPGEIQLSAATHALVQGRVACRDRGLIEVKGKGAMRTYFVDEAAR